MQVLTLTPSEASSKTTGSNVRLTFQWSSVSLPWMMKYRVCDMGSSATYHSVGFCRLSLLSFALSLPHVDCTAAVTVAMVATAVDCPAAAATCNVRQDLSDQCMRHVHSTINVAQVF